MNAKHFTKTKLLIALFLFLTFYLIFYFQKPLYTEKTSAPLTCQNKIVGTSMEPTFYNGEKVCIHTKIKKLHTNDVIVYKLKTSENYFVKRIIALPFDEITFGKDEKIYINGAYLKQPYLKNKKEFYTENIKLLLKQLEHYNFIIPENMVLVLGDNRKESIDSSHFGLLPKDYILGIVSSSK